VFDNTSNTLNRYTAKLMLNGRLSKHEKSLVFSKHHTTRQVISQHSW
jgi:hypothetical protein